MRRTLLAASAFAAVGGALALRAVRLRGVPGQSDGWALQDFRDAVYWPVRALVAGDNPYDMPAWFARYPVSQEFPLYAPHHLLVHAPVAALPYELAAVAYFLLTLACTLALAWASLRVHGQPATLAAVCGLGALVLASRPGHMNVLIGQVTLPVVLGATAALWAGPARPWLAAAGLALAFTKPTYGVPLALLLYCRGDRRPVAIGMALAAAASLPVLVALVAGAGGIAAFVGSVIANQAASSATTVVDGTIGFARVDLWPLVVRLVPSLPIGAQAPLGMAVLLLAALAVRRRAAAGAGRSAETTLLIVLAVLVGVYHQAYDLLLLVPALVGVAVAPRGARLPVLCVGALLVPFLNYAASWPVLRLLQPDALAWHLIAMINPGLLLAVFLVCVVRALRAPVAVPAMATAGAGRAPVVPS